VTAISALENGVITPDTIVECEDEKVFDGFPVSCRNVPQGPGRYPFRNAYTFSVNAIFAEVGVATGWLRLLETAGDLGFGSALDFTTETAPSQVVGGNSELSIPLLASTGFGQGELQATPSRWHWWPRQWRTGDPRRATWASLRSTATGRLPPSLPQPARDERGVSAIMRDFMVPWWTTPRRTECRSRA
jgi:hypothetical protein